MDEISALQLDYTQFLDPQGNLTQALPRFAQDAKVVVDFYRAMVRTRVFDSKAVALQRTGKLGTFASSLGQEAVGVGVGGAMRPEDVLLPSYRDHAAQFLRGVTMLESLLYWSGDERGSDFAGPRQDFPICISIGSQVCHAAGVAYAFKLRREARVAVCIIGDGGTSKGDFYEGLNIAGVWRAPMVVVINNNQWAISVPRSMQTAAQTLAQKAVAAGVEGRQVDGNDVIGVHHVVREAVEKARRGGGPSVIEAITYRLGDHTTADDATRYRDAEIVREQWALEPIARLRAYLAGTGEWDKEQEERLLQESAESVNRAVENFLAIPAPTTEDMFDHLYASLPEAMREQRAAALAFASATGESHG